MDFSVVILAAGQGVRMRSAFPKVLHPIGGVPILERIVITAQKLKPKNTVVVYGHKGEKLQEALQHYPLIWAEQATQQGTGHAVRMALPAVGKVDKILILCGDVPLIKEATLKKLLEKTKDHPLGFITLNTSNNRGLGRVIRNAKGEVISVVEEKDATPEQRNITEINTGIFAVSTQLMQDFLPKLSANNLQKEYYLTDIIKLAVQDQVPILTVAADTESEVLGINDKLQLAQLERLYQKEQAEHLMTQGVTLLDPARFDLRGELTVGEDVVIDINAVFEGKVKLGNQVKIGPNVIIKNSEIHDGTQILANSVIEGAVIGAACSIGPFARIRPGTNLSVNVKVGNFVEMKSASVGSKSKVNHLSYIGDATIGQGVNVGAGTITCNYDGKNKHHTTIGDNVFIGSDTQLIAPVRIGHGATIGAGTTVTRDVDPNHLVHNRIEQRIVKNWAGRETSEE